jgi:glyoxalase family protein
MNIPFEEPIRRFYEEALIFFDPHGMFLELVAYSGAAGRSPCKDGLVPFEYAFRGFYDMNITVEGYKRTASLLSQELGFRHVLEDRNGFRYEVRSGEVQGL